jgi:hypothetical protein
MDGEGFVPVYVPGVLVPDIYRLIGEHLANGSVPIETTPAPAAPAPIPSQVDMAPIAAGAGSSPYVKYREADMTWPDALLRQAYDESPDSMKKLFGYMADHPDFNCSTRNFADALGYTEPKGTWRIAGVLGAFTKRMNGRYGRRVWPFGWVKTENDGALYSMPASIAEKIRSFRQKAA